MSQIIFITGGCRSGKSAFAVSLARAMGCSTRVLATCVPCDAEMEARVAAHRRERPAAWTTSEVGVELEAALAAVTEEIVLLDCVPTWIGNLLMAEPHADAPAESAPAAPKSQRPILSRVQRLRQSLENCPARIALVLGAEVGSSIVPETPLGRLFRDLVGAANQELAAAAARVYLMVAGVPLELKKCPLADLAAEIMAHSEKR